MTRAFEGKDRITADDVLALRRSVFRDGGVSEDEVRSLLFLGRKVPAGEREWPQFLCEAVTDWAARQASPQGYVSAEAGRILIDAMGAPEEACDLTLDILSHLFHHARQVPDALSAYALLCVRAAVLADGRVCAREVRALRQFLHAPGGDGAIGITQVEADLVFDIKDAAEGQENDPAWPLLFRQVVAAFVMGHASYQTPSFEKARRLDAFITAPGGIEWAPARPRRGMLATFWRGLKGEDSVETLAAERAAQRAADAAKGRVLTCGEIDWLIGRIGRDGAVDIAERALIAQLADLAEEGGGSLPLRLSQLAG